MWKWVDNKVGSSCSREVHYITLLDTVRALDMLTVRFSSVVHWTETPSAVSGCGIRWCLLRFAVFWHRSCFMGLLFFEDGNPETGVSFELLCLNLPLS